MLKQPKIIAPERLEEEPTPESCQTLELPSPPQHRSLYDNVLHQFNAAADLIDLDRSVRKILARTKNEIVVNFPVRRDNGEVDLFTGYRVQHNDTLGPFKGGLRFHPDVNLDEVRAWLRG